MNQKPLRIRSLMSVCSNVYPLPSRLRPIDQSLMSVTAAASQTSDFNFTFIALENSLSV